MDGFFGLVVEGRQRRGKSSYCSQALAEVHGEWEHKEDVSVCVEQNYEETKRWIVFPPIEFLDLVLSIRKKELALLWDDAGFWLFVLDWYDPFVKAVSKYMQLSGRQFSAILLTTPNKKLISSKVLESLPEIYVCKIIKEGRETYRYRPRMAKVYERWDYPDGKKGGVKTRWIDHFNAILPDDFYAWYKPKSDHYMEIGLELLKKEILLLQKKMNPEDKKDLKDEVVEDAYKVAGDPRRLKEVREVIANLSK